MKLLVCGGDDLADRSAAPNAMPLASGATTGHLFHLLVCILNGGPPSIQDRAVVALRHGLPEAWRGFVRMVVSRGYRRVEHARVAVAP
jgi:hypothetical protein